MLPQEVPQWLKQRFVKSVVNIGATTSEESIGERYDVLLSIWCMPERHFHNIRHVLDMLTQIDELAPEVTDSDSLRIAAWYHGVVFTTDEINVYAHNGGEDEVASAKMCADDLSALGVSADRVKYISGLITGMKRAGGTDQRNADTTTETAVMNPIIIDQLVLRDAHLGFLAAEPQKYRRYVEHVREEYIEVPAAHFYYARKQIVTHLLARKHLFISPLAQKWESTARDNLKAELERINAELDLVDSGELERLSIDFESESDASDKEAKRPKIDTSDHDDLFTLSEDVEDPDSDMASDLAPQDKAAEDQVRVNMPEKQEAPRSSLETLDESLDP
ncbi:MAG: hypothetical protein PUK40_02890 [Actinomycetaceae bacterium]|nr:hypothetical protein [Arcanobacterium sp.]MDD7504887.1 hypothetical protein [Actinomycetaceae bacterium]